MEHGGEKGFESLTKYADFYNYGSISHEIKAFTRFKFCNSIRIPRRKSLAKKGKKGKKGKKR
jgi:hypothetical protein